MIGLQPNNTEAGAYGDEGLLIVLELNCFVFVWNEDVEHGLRVRKSRIEL